MMSSAQATPIAPLHRLLNLLRPRHLREPQGPTPSPSSRELDFEI